MFSDVTVFSIASMSSSSPDFRLSKPDCNTNNNNNNSNNNNNVIADVVDLTTRSSYSQLSSCSKDQNKPPFCQSNDITTTTTTTKTTSCFDNTSTAFNSTCKKFAPIKTQSFVAEENSSSDEQPTTPTSSDHRIPEIRPCPPAPRKPRSETGPVSSKRKCYQDRGGKVICSSKSASRLLDFSKEVESMFPPMIQANLGRKIKKARSI